MNTIHVLFKFAINPYKGIEIDTTSSSGKYSDLSPFKLNATKYGAKNFENLWQFSKVYAQHVLYDGTISKDWYKWRDNGFNNQQAIRYPIGKGAKPYFSYWNGEQLTYIEARKKIYVPIYAELVKETNSFKLLKELYEKNNILVLRDYDAYDHIKFRITLKEVINNPDKKCGHAFILAMILQNELEECIK